MPYYIREVLFFILAIFQDFWWLLFLFLLGGFFINLRKQHKEKVKKEKEAIKDWAVLEVKINREIVQTPKSIEQVFNSLNVIEKGCLCLEIVGINREMHFIIRTPQEYKNLVISQFYSQYPELEIKEIEDYFASVAPNLPNKDNDLWGMEINLSKPNCYPIKTYSVFEEKKEEKRIDPIASLAETLGTLERSEWCIFQILLRTLSKDEEKELSNEGKKEIDKLLGKKEAIKITWTDWVAAFFRNLLVGLVEPPVWPEKEEQKEKSSSEISLSDREKIQAIEKKMGQLSFKTGIRVLYVSPRSEFEESKAIGFMAYLKQFNSKDLNAFEINKDTTTKLKTKFFQARRLFLKKRKFYQTAFQRRPEKKSMILTTEELATIYHFPAVTMKTPTLTRVLSKKSEPPIGLPTG